MNRHYTLRIRLWIRRFTDEHEFKVLFVSAAVIAYLLVWLGGEMWY